MNSSALIKRSLSATVGYLLSPFSWWNDLYINFPIAYGMAYLHVVPIGVRQSGNGNHAVFIDFFIAPITISF